MNSSNDIKDNKVETSADDYVAKYHYFNSARRKLFKDNNIGIITKIPRVAAPLPTDNLITTLVENKLITAKQVKEWTEATRLLADARVATLILDFIEMKKISGSTIEKKLYTDMTLEAFITRLLTKRPIMFMGGNDEYILRDGSNSYHYARHAKQETVFEKIGTLAEKNNNGLILSEYISYDEMEISSLIGISSPTYFINEGERGNLGKHSNAKNHETFGIFVGLIGARFEKRDSGNYRMESKYMLVIADQNTTAHGYGRNGKNPQLEMWKRFYGVSHFPTYEEVQNDNSGRYVKFTDPDGSNKYFDTVIYKEHMRGKILSYLAHANQCGADVDKQVYLRAVGLGTGAWSLPFPCSEQQEKIQLELYREILATGMFDRIANVDFCWFKNIDTSGLATKAGNTILHYTENAPATKLIDADKNKLLVASYAWDSNSFGGNEYWNGSFASGDPTAALCSLIAQFHCPDNPKILGENTLFCIEGQMHSFDTQSKLAEQMHSVSTQMGNLKIQILSIMEVDKNEKIQSLLALHVQYMQLLYNNDRQIIENKNDDAAKFTDLDKRMKELTEQLVSFKVYRSGASLNKLLALNELKFLLKIDQPKSLDEAMNVVTRKYTDLSEGKESKTKNTIITLRGHSALFANHSKPMQPSLKIERTSGVCFTFKTLIGQTLIIDVAPEDTLGDLKQKIAESLSKFSFDISSPLNLAVGFKIHSVGNKDNKNVSNYTNETLIADMTDIFDVRDNHQGVLLRPKEGDYKDSPFVYNPRALLLNDTSESSGYKKQ